MLHQISYICGFTLASVRRGALPFSRRDTIRGFAAKLNRIEWAPEIKISNPRGENLWISADLKKSLVAVMALVLQLSNFPARTFHMWCVIMLMLLCNSVSPGSLLDRGGSWLRSLSTLQSLDKKNPCTILILSGILRHYVCHATHTVCLIAWPW